MGLHGTSARDVSYWPDSEICCIAANRSELGSSGHGSGYGSAVETAQPPCQHNIRDNMRHHMPYVVLICGGLPGIP
jgi:hypothetical protein